MVKLAAATGRYPLAVATDCVVYPAVGPSPLDVLPYGPDGKPAVILGPNGQADHRPAPPRRLPRPRQARGLQAPRGGAGADG
ncbi:hypothetical protein GCM10010430_74760 [Kitasatospora cystarginea]|uniref:Uncharacterized protein n=1 Tax=Kitasatospora cystarginea TaxID=58350 RepID=A0ABP5RWJ9_9ACTN